MGIFTSRRSRVSLVLVVSVFAIFAAYRIVLMRQVAETKADLRARGILFPANELDHLYPPVPHEINAARLYDEASRNVLQFRFIEADIEARWNPFDATEFDANQLDRVRIYLEENSESLQAFDDAARLSKSRFPIDLTQPTDDFSFESAVGNVISPGIIRIRYLTRFGDGDAALAAIDSALAFSRHLAACPSARGQVMANNLKAELAGLAFDLSETLPQSRQECEQTIERMLTSHEISAWSAAVTRELSVAYAGGDDFRRNRAGYVDPQIFLEQLLYGELPWLGRAFTVLQYVLGGFDRQRLNDLRLAERIYVDLTERGPFNDQPDYLLDYEEFDKYRSQQMARTITYSDLFGTRSEQFQTLALIRAHHTACAVERFRASEDRMPYGLEELVPTYLASIPLDPYDGKPMRIADRTSSYTIYAVGTDLRDDVGAVRSRFGGRDVGVTISRDVK
jgi:hypothetical protein